MKIAVAQIKSIEGETEMNLKNHLKLIQTAVTHDVEAIFFPELSLTGYITSKARLFAINANDSRLAPLQKLVDREGIYVGVGAPVESEGGVFLAMLIFSAEQSVMVKEKTLLHADEIPYFQSRDSLRKLKIQDERIGLGICYESLQAEYISEIANSGVDVYLASVSKDQKGILTACRYFKELSLYYQTPILMANSVGECSDFINYGNSAIWNDKGELCGQLNETQQGLLIYDTMLERSQIVYL